MADTWVRRCPRDVSPQTASLALVWELLTSPKTKKRNSVWDDFSLKAHWTLFYINSVKNISVLINKHFSNICCKYCYFKIILMEHFCIKIVMKITFFPSTVHFLFHSSFKAFIVFLISFHNNNKNVPKCPPSCDWPPTQVWLLLLLSLFFCTGASAVTIKLFEISQLSEVLYFPAGNDRTRWDDVL